MRWLLTLCLLAGCKQLLGIEEREPLNNDAVNADVRMQIVGALPEHGELGANVSLPAIQVRLVDPNDELLSTRSDEIELSLVTIDSGDRLIGTLTKTAIRGVATFNDLAINRAASHLRLRASSGDLGDAESVPFSISSAAILAKFRGSLRYEIPTPFVHHAIATDLNGDANNDLVATLGPVRKIAVFLNQGEGTFAAPVEVATSTHEAESLAAGDLDGDGMTDLVIGSRESDAILIFFGDGSGGFRIPPTEIAVCDQPISVVVADVTSDDRPDIAVRCMENDSLQFMRNASTGSQFQLAATTSLSLDMPGCPGGCVRAADFNRDGRTDLLATSVCSRVSVLLQHDTIPNTFRAAQVTQNFGGHNRNISLADLDNDTDLDIVAGSGHGNTPGNPVSYRFNSTAMNATTVSLGASVDLASGVPMPGDHAVAAVDLDMDGAREIISVFNGSTRMLVYSNEVGPPVTFGAHSDVELDKVPYSLEVGQLDGVGGEDLVVGFETSQLMVIFSRL